MISDLLYGSANLAVWCAATDDTSRWAVTFESFTTTPDLNRPAFGEQFFASRGISCIAVRCATNAWYQYDDMLTALATIRARLAGAARVMTYGSSMGGYAAIRFADAVGANACLALSPQYSNDRRKVPFEWRWGQQSRAIRWRPELDGPIRSRIAPVVVYDARGEDRLQAERIAQDIPIVAIPLPFSGHPVATFINSIGMLEAMVMDVLDGRFDPHAFRAAARSTRGQDPIYLSELGKHQPAWRSRLGVTLARAAVARAPGYELVEHQLALRLTMVGEHEEALALHERVRAVVGRDAGYALPYSDALLKAGRLDDALVIAREVVADHPDMAHARNWLGHLLFVRGDLPEAIVHATAARRAASHWLYRRTLWHYRWRLARRSVLRLISLVTRGRARADELGHRA